MMRALFLYLSNQKQLHRFARSNPLSRKAASRFVAGETLDTASAAVKELNAKGIMATLDLLGESVTKPEEARAAAESILAIFDRIAADRLDCNVSVKLTQLGLDLSSELVRENVRRLLDRGKQHGIFMRLDMESSAHTERTLALFEELYPVYGRDLVGIVLQSYLHRSMRDTERAIELGCRVRLCKGAYREPASVAFQAKRDVDANFVRMMEALLARGHYPGLATHDPVLIAHAKRFTKDQGIAPDRFEFQFLYGIGRDIQEQLVKEGYRMRVYVPFGTHWYPYTMRRFAERPANVWFVVKNVLHEGLR
jgi:proline dehydrogenase